MTERERLIELCLKCDKDNDVLECYNERPTKRQAAEILADYLLANGVIVPPVAVGQMVWFVRNGKVIETSVEKVVVKHGGLYFKMECNAMYETAVSAIGKTVFLTREEAEKALAERSKE